MVTEETRLNIDKPIVQQSTMVGSLFKECGFSCAGQSRADGMPIRDVYLVIIRRTSDKHLMQLYSFTFRTTSRKCRLVTLMKAVICNLISDTIRKKSSSITLCISLSLKCSDWYNKTCNTKVHTKCEM